MQYFYAGVPLLKVSGDIVEHDVKPICSTDSGCARSLSSGPSRRMPAYCEKDSDCDPGCEIGYGFCRIPLHRCTCKNFQEESILKSRGEFKGFGLP